MNTYRLAYAYPSSEFGGKAGGWFWEAAQGEAPKKPESPLYASARAAVLALKRGELYPVTVLNATISATYLLSQPDLTLNDVFQPEQSKLGMSEDVLLPSNNKPQQLYLEEPTYFP
ncbi:MAG: hypothetical protein ACK5Y2_12045 [Bdellovibrionales bacterium]